MPQDPIWELDRRSELRDVTHRLMITRLRSGAISMAIISRRSASLMAARTAALPTLARSAIRATGRVHFPVAGASFRMTASTASYRCSEVHLLRAVRPRSQQAPEVRSIQESTCPISFNGRGEAKVGAADFGQRPLSSTRDVQPMNSQPGKLSVLPGRVKTGGVTPVVYDGHFRGCIHL
jgi:hypothetical protein